MNLFRQNDGAEWKPTQEEIQWMDQRVRAVQTNPSGFISKNFGKNVPEGMHDPRQIAQHLKSTGQLNQSQMQMLRRFGM